MLESQDVIMGLSIIAAAVKVRRCPRPSTGSVRGRLCCSCFQTQDGQHQPKAKTELRSKQLKGLFLRVSGGSASPASQISKGGTSRESWGLTYMP